MAYAFGMGHGFGFGLGFLNFLGTLLFILLIIWAVKMIARGRWPGHWGERRGRPHWHWDGPGAARPDEAMTTARERLASGEIGPEDFEAIKQGLAHGATADMRPDSALALARLRLAKSEITLAEFDAIRKALS